MSTDNDFLSTLGAHKSAKADILYDKYMGNVYTIICPNCGTAHAAIKDAVMMVVEILHRCPQCDSTIYQGQWNIKPGTTQHGRKEPLRPGLFIEQKPDEIRALSWKQPYASLMLHGKIETRVWDTKYRGYVLICASKIAYAISSLLGISGQYQMVRMQNTLKRSFQYLPHGQAIAIGKLVNSRPMTKADEDACFVEYQQPWLVERKMKDGTTHRVQQLWCHIYEDVHAIEPFDWKGSQGWRTLTFEDKNKIVIL